MISPIRDRVTTEGSAAMLEEARKVVAAGVSSSFRLTFKPPLFFQSGAGARIVDVDGNEYVDYVMGMGSAILGHANEAVAHAVQGSLSSPMCYGGQHPGEIALAAEVVDHVPCAERVRFCTSGTEAVQAGLRLARAATGRDLIVRFTGHYHGWMDSIYVGPSPDSTPGSLSDDFAAAALSKGQPRSILADVVILPWNDVDALRSVFAARGEQIATVLMEPILCNAGVVYADSAFLREASDLCNAYGSLLFFDEVITGFRVDIGGAQTVLGVTPDIASFGKALANGFPASCLAGSAEVMDLLARGDVIHSGTYNGNPSAMAAGIATLAYLENHAVHEHMTAIGSRLITGLKAAAAAAGLPVIAQGHPAAFGVAVARTGSPTEETAGSPEIDTARTELFIDLMLDRGVRIMPRAVWFLSAAHGDDDVEITLAAAADAFASLAHGHELSN